MPFDKNSVIWTNRSENFFRNQRIEQLRQSGPHCVSTVLAMLARCAPEKFQGAMNTQDPVSWSEALRPFGMKLAYCPTDARKLRHYLPELVELDDLFTLSYYSPTDPKQVLEEPDENGWVCGSHIVLLHRDEVLDPASGSRVKWNAHTCVDRYTKRIFRVVPGNHVRGL